MIAYTSASNEESTPLASSLLQEFTGELFKNEQLSDQEKELILSQLLLQLYDD